MLYAIADRDDSNHRACVRLVQDWGGALHAPTLILAEVGYFLEQRMGPDAEARFLASVADGQILLEHPTQGDLVRMVELVQRYGDWPLGTVDASVIATAERLNITTIATLDRRHFGAVKPRHIEAFELVP